MPKLRDPLDKLIKGMRMIKHSYRNWNVWQIYVPEHNYRGQKQVNKISNQIKKSWSEWTQSAVWVRKQLTYFKLSGVPLSTDYCSCTLIQRQFFSETSYNSTCSTQTTDNSRREHTYGHCYKSAASHHHGKHSGGRFSLRKIKLQLVETHFITFKDLPPYSISATIDPIS
jgi:hypothetical protein